MNRFGWRAGPRSASMKSCARPAAAVPPTCSTTGPHTPMAPSTWATRSTKGLRTLSSNPKPWPALTLPTSPDTTATACPLKSKWMSSWDAKSWKCRSLTCWKPAAPMPRSTLIYKPRSLSALAVSDAGTSLTKPWPATTRPALWKPFMASLRRASFTAASSPSIGASTTAPPWPRPKSSMPCTPAPRSTCATASPPTRQPSTPHSAAARSTPSSGPPPPGPCPRPSP